MNYNMKCLICGHTDTNLVRIQEHAMTTHGYTQEDLRVQTRREIDLGHYVFTFSDDTDWLDAERSGGNVVGGV
jgi:hypothetical protein